MSRPPPPDKTSHDFKVSQAQTILRCILGSRQTISKKKSHRFRCFVQLWMYFQAFLYDGIYSFAAIWIRPDCFHCNFLKSVSSFDKRFGF